MERTGAYIDAYAVCFVFFLDEVRVHAKRTMHGTLHAFHMKKNKRLGSWKLIDLTGRGKGDREHWNDVTCLM